MGACPPNAGVSVPRGQQEKRSTPLKHSVKLRALLAGLGMCFLFQTVTKEQGTFQFLKQGRHSLVHTRQSEKERLLITVASPARYTRDGVSNGRSVHNKASPPTYETHLRLTSQSLILKMQRCLFEDTKGILGKLDSPGVRFLFSASLLIKSWIDVVDYVGGVTLHA